MKKYALLLTIIITPFLFLSFLIPKDKTVSFQYAKRKETKISFLDSGFGKFQKEIRGEDYYYSAVSQDTIICSVLYYKLNEQEKKMMVEPFGGMSSPGIPAIFFSQKSNLKDYESNKSSWGEMTDDFMYRQCDIEEFRGVKLNQKHMYAYGMFGDDLFVNIHLSKTNCTAKDSTKMRLIIDSVKKVEKK